MGGDENCSNSLPGCLQKLSLPPPLHLLPSDPTSPPTPSPNPLQSDSVASELPSEEVARRRLKQRSGRPEKVVERSRQHLMHLQAQQERERARERESSGE